MEVGNSPESLQLSIGSTGDRGYDLFLLDAV
jgi:hypothetical protein